MKRCKHPHGVVVSLRGPTPWSRYKKQCRTCEAERPRRATVGPVTLCGSMFGLDVRRHRCFETSFAMIQPSCNHAAQNGSYPQATNRVNRRKTVEVGVYRIPLEVQRKAMGIDWMTLPELSQAIPPAYARYIGTQALEAMRRAA